ncbi:MULTISPECIES: hypothetical protein [unclassified Bradyrhizobium]|uniref:hypothetical protein n=1 Tax=unclassified Bradyrhizobium TaxID=2631580 RepID=UPI002FF21CA2
MSNIRFGPWLCENAKTLNRDRRSYSSKTALGLQFESAFNLEIELKNAILVTFRLFAFLHSQGQKQKSSPALPYIRGGSKSGRLQDFKRFRRTARQPGVAGHVFAKAHLGPQLCLMAQRWQALVE